MTRNDIINLTVLGQVEAALDMNSLKIAKEVMEQRNKGLLMLPKSIQKRVDDFVNRYNEANESQAVEESFEDDFITYTMNFDVDVEKSYKDLHNGSHDVPSDVEETRTITITGSCVGYFEEEPITEEYEIYLTNEITELA